MSGIGYTLEGGVARVTIDRPGSLNAIDAAADRELNRIWAEIEADDSVRAVVLTGAGERAFCVGADVGDDEESGAGEGGGAPQSDLEYWAGPRANGFGGISLRETLEVPVIARVNGYALGGGLEMVLGCDIVIAAVSAQLGLPEPRLGRQPLDGGMVQLPRRLPHAVAMDLLLTGRRIKAEEAFRIGLVTEVVADAELDAAVDRKVAEVLACGPLSVRAIKQFVLRTRELPAAEARYTLTPALKRVFESDESDEGVASFVEKRPPAWAPPPREQHGK